MNLANLYDWDSTIFENMIWPNGVNKELAVQNIIFHGGLLTPVYGEPSFLKKINETWSKIHLDDFTRYWNALHQEYNPIENYDRITNGSRAIIDDGSYNNHNNGDSTNTVAPFNSNSWNNSDKNEIDNNSNGSSTNDRREGYGERVHGNIGVTTTQQMIEQELKLCERNFYDYVADKYINDMCLGVW